MSDWFLTATQTLLHWLAIPEVGLGAVFLMALVSATLLPMGSEPAVFGLVKLQPDMFWPAVLVATLGNTLGGAITWWMGRAAREAADRLRHRSEDHAALGGASSPARRAQPEGGAAAQRAARWLQRFGAQACLLSWLPVVGDPLCAVAGWLRLPFWPCLAYMALGKLARYLCMTALLLHLV
jgi:membrane protein YqaA with SNARE-associated domain